MRKILSIVGIVVLLIVVGYVIFTKTQTEDYSYILLKINPEVELGVDAENIVREVTPLNEDADILLSDMELIGKSIETVTEELIDSTVEIGKLENTIELTVMNASEEIRLQLENRVKTKIEAHIQEKNYIAQLTVKGVTEEMKAAAEKYEISNGKMLLVSKALELNPELKEEDIAKKEVKDIQGYIKESVVERHEQMNKPIEELEETWKNQKSELRINNPSSGNSQENTQQNQNTVNPQGENNTQNGSANGR